MRRARAFMAAAIAAVAFPATAQYYQPDLATDHELLAAYCTGFANHQLTTYRSEHFDRSEAQDRLIRARSYLAARGYLNVRSPVAKNGIEIAIRQAAQDDVACGKDSLACFQRCGLGETADTCVDQCLEPSNACAATRRCYGKLPY